MDLALTIQSGITNYAARLPHAFLNYLLAEGYQFDTMLCLRLTSGFGNTVYCAMSEFKPAGSETVDIDPEINRHLNLIDGEYVHVDKVDPQVPAIIVIQGHNESFGEITDLKSQLESLLVRVRVLNVGAEFMVNGPSQSEWFTISKILDNGGTEMSWGMTVDVDIKVDFIPTREAEARLAAEAAEKARIAAEAEKKAAGHRLGGNADRQAWLDRLQASIRKTQ